MHHKRYRPKHQRAGCILCKPHKDERGKGDPSREAVSVQRRLQDPVVSQTSYFGGTWDPDNPSWQDLEEEDKINDAYYDAY